MKKIFSLLLVLFVCIVSGCSCDKDEPVKTTIYASYIAGFEDKDSYSYITVAPFGTNVSLTGYNEDDVKDLEKTFNSLVYKYHSLLDRNYYYRDKEGNIINNITVINDSYGSGESVVVDEIIIEILKEAIKYTKWSNGKFNIFSGTLVDVWEPSFNVLNDEYYGIDPSEESINSALLCVPTVSELDSVFVIDEENKTVTFNKFDGCESGASITLGALAKSYFLDKIANMEEFDGLDAAIYDAGQSSIIVKGGNPLREGGVFNIALKNSISGDYLAQLQLNEDSAVSTSSGDYKGYVKADGTRRYHIIDATSGYPNGQIAAVTVVGDSAMIMDILTTTFLTMNLEEIKEYILFLKDKGDEFKILIQDGVNKKFYANSSMKDSIGEIYNNAVIEDFTYGA